MKVLKFSVILILIVTAINCSSINSINANKQNWVEKGFTKGIIIDKTGLDGCSFLIQLKDSSIFNPINIKDEFKEEGITVFFKYNRSKQVTICMNGAPIIVYEMVKR
jgi:hypothetical protein